MRMNEMQFRSNDGGCNGDCGPGGSPCDGDCGG
jgi:hypothetical protein